MEYSTDIERGNYYAALKARDKRFDGQFFVAVSSTGIYCRPVCPARTPAEKNCRFFSNAPSVEAEGFRPCLRCRPELAPGHAPIDTTQRVAHQAAARIRAGALNDEGLESLAAEFALSSRQLRRVIEAEFGVTPVIMAQTQRLLLAKQLLTDTQMKVVDIAYACGFSSLRQFNRVFLDRYRMSPTALRKNISPIEEGAIVLKLGYREPLDWPGLTAFLISRGNPRLEQSFEGRFVRTLQLDNHKGWVAAKPSPKRSVIEVEVSPSLLPVLPKVADLLRYYWDLNTQADVVAEHLGSDSTIRKEVVAAKGTRVPGAVDGFELALRAVLGQQISVKAATTIFGRFVDSFGEPVETPYAGLDRCSPDPGRVGRSRLLTLIKHGLTERRAKTVQTLAREVASDRIKLQYPEREGTREALLAIPGIGPWTVEYIAMRCLRDPDAFPSSDLGLMKAMDIHKPKALEQHAEAWRPWRAYAATTLWNSLGAGG